MSHDGRRPARGLGVHRLVGGWRSHRGAGVGLRRRRSERMRPEVDLLEVRTMLSASPIMGPMPAPAPAPAPAQETFNLQLQPGSVAALSQLTPVITAAGATVQATTIAGLYAVQGPAANLDQLAEALAANPAVQYADPSQSVQDLTLPNDPDYDNGDEWQLNGTWGINAPGAWTVTTGSDKVIVADTDTGIDYNHPDLIDNVWINQAEIPSTVLPDLTDVYNDGAITFTDLNNPIDQGPGKITPVADSYDNGALVVDGSSVLAPTSSGGWASGSTQDGDTAHPDDLIGWNFAAITTSTPNGTNNPLDQNGHGTFTAGEIAEVGNNGIGGTGVDWNVQLMPVQFLDSSGNGSDTAAAEAIEYAVNHGAKVINASWGGSGVDPTIAAAIQYADNAGVIIVAAAGNNGTDDDNSSTWFSPASYSSEYANVISVAAINADGTLPSWSDYGVGTIQLAAPGANVYGVGLNGTYTTDSGTSMAAPLVTGTIALVEAAHPSWSMSQVIDAVLDTTTPDPALVGKVTTGGIVNAAAAVANTDGPYVVSATPDGSVNAASGLSSVQLDFNEEINPATFTPSQITITGPGGTVTGVTVTPVSGSNDHEFTIAFPAQSAAGSYTLKVGPDVQDWYGNDMNQNRNGVNGEAADAFVETIRQTAPGSTDLLSVTGIPAAVTAGSPETFTVTALSPGGGTDTAFLGTVQFSSTDPKAVLPANFTFIAADDGQYTFTVTFKTAGTQSITATDTTTSTITGTEGGITVSPAAASSFKVTGFPSPDTAGAAENITVTAFDPYGNIATGYTGTVHFTSSDPKAVLPANFAFTTAYDGQYTFTATLETAGTQSITATDTSSSTITGSQTGIKVNAAAATLLMLSGFPGTVTAGAADNFTVTAYDAYGNIATGYTGTVHFTSSDPKAVLPANFPFSSANAGQSTFSVTFETAGTQSITATDTTTSTITGTASVSVAAASTAATFLKQDPTTQGTWIHTYGAQGYDVIGSSSSVSIPSYATVTPAGQSGWTWASSTTDTRALQVAGGASRIAAAWYAATSFTVDVDLTDGQQHDLELYFLDWDSSGRSEQVQITNAATGAVLSTQTVSSFQSGIYLDYTISGNVLITITREAGTNAVLNGLFLNSPPGPTATLLEQDTTTQGTWIHTYGAQGYDVIGSSSSVSIPSYATVAPSGQSGWTWASSTTDTRALQVAGGASRIAAAWYATTSFTVDVDLTDGQQHDLELYFLDWDKQGRSEQVQITNAATGAVLSTQTVSSFQSGIYLDYAISGNVLITITKEAGTNAVLNGLFLDSPPGPSATFLKQDTTTQGTWIGTYGAQGYDVINDAASLPSYATVTPSGQLSYTWASSTTDRRALQVPGGSGRIAATWFSTTSFTVDVDLTDGQTHDLELYFLDWDKQGRSEQVQITNAATGAVLSTQTVSSFQSGIYLDYTISGNVLITITREAGTNAVLSGLFLDPSTGTTSTAAIVTPGAVGASDGIGGSGPSALAMGALNFGGDSNGPGVPAAVETSSTWDGAVLRRRKG